MGTALPNKTLARDYLVLRPCFRPKCGRTHIVIEVHFFQEQLDDIYDKIIMVEFLERIRDEKKFPSPNKLIEQLKKDKARCLELQAKYE
jgi:riboflavin kinase/FMN adenylyltransferase